MKIHSMTGFGSGQYTEETNLIGELSIEIKSVNNRYLDINIRTGRNIGFVEEKIRQYIKNNLNRGRVDVNVQYKPSKENSCTVVVNENLAKSYYDAGQLFSEKFGLETLTNDVLLRLPEVCKIEYVEQDQEKMTEIAVEVLSEAVDKLISMRAFEGEQLVKDITERTDIIEKNIMEVEKLSHSVVEESREKLNKRLKELLEGKEWDENRFQTEVAYIADRSNITEEIVRMKSHIVHIRDFLKKGGTIGRKLDFLVQEMNRETNTINSKTSSIAITNIILDTRSEIEKIREQVQNIE